METRKAKEWFAVASAESLYTFYTVQDPLPYLTQPYPLISSDGKLGISSYEDFAMPESLQNKDLAWEFIKYCLSAREDPTFYELTGFRWPYVAQGFPLNRENYRKMVEYIAAGNAYGTATIGYPGNYKGIDPESLLAKLDEMLTCDPVNVNAYNVDSRYASIISGVPGGIIEDVTLTDINLYYKGGYRAEDAPSIVPEQEKAYPEPWMFGTIPAKGFYIRHAKNVFFNQINFYFEQPDERPLFVTDDAENILYRDIRVDGRLLEKE